MSLKFLLLLPFAVLPWNSLSAAVVYYSETFPNTAGNNNRPHNHSEVGWQAHIGAGATANSSNTGNTGGFVVPDSVGGYGAKANTGNVGIAWTNEFTSINMSLTEITSLSFRSNNNNASDVMRFAVRIDSQWYITTQTFTHAGGGIYNDWSVAENEVFNFTTNAASWQLLNFIPGTPGGTLSTGGVLSSALPTGTLDAAGIYLESNSGVVRYDDFTINVVPEPSAAALVVAGLAGVALRRRRSA